MTQQQFSHTLGFPLATLKKWETGARKPEGAARILLRTIAYSPKTVLAANMQPTT
jgi:putative transcriptional regulator